MPFRKGISGNSNGRPKGSPNKTTAEIKSWVMELISNNQETFEANLKQVEPEKFILIFEKLLNFVLPKASTIEVNDTSPQPIRITVSRPEYADALKKLYAEMDDPGAMKIEVSNEPAQEPAPIEQAEKQKAGFNFQRFYGQREQTGYRQSRI